jgi:dTDP-4-dehydrorhamnose 3,5-epimerase
MESLELANGLFVLQPDLFKDKRGTFNVVFYHKEFNFNMVQLNQSLSKRGVLRGLHFQEKPFEQSKIVWCSKGSILDVVVDLRPDSETFGQNFKVVLDDKDRKTILIPKGFAHGFLCLEDDTVVNYAVDFQYAPEFERSIFAFDEELNIDWGVDFSDVNLSDRDMKGQSFNSCKDKFFNYGR